MLRRILTVVVVVGMFPAPTALAQSQDSFVFEGAGWGHGVGMSHWGSYGQALSNPDKSGEDIAAHYFPGSKPASLDDLSLPNNLLNTLENPLWVNLGSQVTLLEFTAVGGPLELCLAGDGEGPCPKPERPQAGERWELRRIASGKCGFFHGGAQQGTAGDCRASIAWPDAAGVRLRHGPDRSKICASRSNEVCEYRHGELKIRDDPVEAGFHVILTIGLEDYLRGVAEVLDHWAAPGVNQAQAVAARTYAVFKYLQRETGTRPADPDADPGISAYRKDRCWCHLYDSWLDINYIGWAKETRSNGSAWLKGVGATAGRVLTYFGEGWESVTEAGVIQAFFSASSGGITRSNIYGFFTEWNGNTPRQVQWPYLAPVTDPWDIDPAVGNPNASWERRVSASALARLLGWERVTEAVLVDRDSLSTPARVRFSGVDDGQQVSTTVAGAWLRTGLGLRSSVITAIDGKAPAALPPDPPPDTPGTGENPGGSPEPDSFDDDDGGTHEPAINRLASDGVLAGTECGPRRICPNDPLQRWEMAVWMTRILDQTAGPFDTQTEFSDVDSDAWWVSHVGRLADLGVTKGCGTNPLRYCPDQPVTRAQMASFLVRAFDTEEAPSAGFVDTGGNTHQADIDALAAVGITKGCQTNPLRYCPDQPVTRAQMASFLVRALDLVPGSTGGA